jgi:transposase
MMGKQPNAEPKLFYYNLNLDERIRNDHPLRTIKTLVDFDFVSEKVEPLYGINGNVSVPPPVILKLMFLLFFYDVPSERELMATAPERLDWLWFLDFDLDSAIPDHSVLSKARTRWGREAFEEFFEHVVWQCVEAGLVEGEKIFCDSSLIQADASNASVVDRQAFRRYANRTYRELEGRLDEAGDQRRYVSTTDPEASVVKKSAQKAKVRYGEHRAVDSKAGVITATQTTPGAVNEAHLLGELLDGHHDATGMNASVVVADSKYGTVDNFLKLSERGVRGHIPDLSARQKGSNRRAGIFDISEFLYDEATDTYMCPAGQRLRPSKRKKKRKAVEYGASSKTCVACEIREHCTRNKTGSRTIKRHLRQEELDAMRRISKSTPSRRDLRTRKHFMERSYADAANNHGFKRSRWRGLEKAAIQNLLIAAAQNIRLLIKHRRGPLGLAQQMRMAGRRIACITAPVYQALRSAMISLLDVTVTVHSRLSEDNVYRTSHSVSMEQLFGQQAVKT